MDQATNCFDASYTRVPIINPPSAGPLVDAPSEPLVEPLVEPPVEPLVVPLVDTLTDTPVDAPPELLVGAPAAGPAQPTPWISTAKPTPLASRPTVPHLVGPFKSHRVPTWLRRRIRESFSGQVGHVAAVCLFDWLLARTGRGWLDHFGFGTFRDRPVIISRPYGMGKHGVLELVEFCRALDLDFEIDCHSNYHAPGTILILIFAPDNAEGRPHGWNR